MSPHVSEAVGGHRFGWDLKSSLVYRLVKYSEERMKVIRSHIMKQNANLQEGISQA